MITLLRNEIAYFADCTGKAIRLKISSVIREGKDIAFVTKKIPNGINPDKLDFSGFRNPMIRMDVTNMNYNVITETEIPDIYKAYGEL